MARGKAVMVQATGSEAKHVAVIGAGIVGVSTAIWLQRDGHKVTLIDPRGPGSQASHGNGGVLAACSVVPINVPSLLRTAPGMLMKADSPLFLRWSYVPRMMPWLLRYLSHCRASETTRIAAALHQITGDTVDQHRALAAGTSAEKWIVPSDYLFVYTDRAHFEADRFGWSLRARFGFKWEELEQAAFFEYDPVFGPGFDFAARMADHGHITDPGRYVGDLATHVESEGGTILRATAQDFRFEDDQLVAVETDVGPVACDAGVITAGVWSGGLMERLGLKVPLESERGYHIDLIEPSVMPRAPVMIASGKFVATPMDGRLRCAGIVEFGGLDAPPSSKPFDLLRRQAGKAMPGLKWRECIEWMGHRPAPSDSIPVIGEITGRKGLFAGFGHHHIGMTGGPKTGRLIADLIGGRTPNTDLAAYAPNRF